MKPLTHLRYWGWPNLCAELVVLGVPVGVAYHVHRNTHTPMILCLLIGVALFLPLMMFVDAIRRVFVTLLCVSDDGGIFMRKSCDVLDDRKKSKLIASVIRHLLDGEASAASRIGSFDGYTPSANEKEALNLLDECYDKDTNTYDTALVQQHRGKLEELMRVLREDETR
jgi:hypothetical protein